MTDKPLLKSKTFWLSTIALLMTIAAYVAEVIPGSAATVATIVQVLSVLNRIITETKIKGIMLVLLALTLGSASEAQAGPLSRLFGGRLQRSCATCNVRAPVQSKAKPQYRVECRGGVCRLVPVK